MSTGVSPWAGPVPVAPSTSTRSWPWPQRTARVMVPPAACLMALVTRSLVSRIATSGSTGGCQPQMSSLTWLRASAAAAGRAVSRIRHLCRSVGRVGAMVFIGFLRGRVADPAERWSLRARRARKSPSGWSRARCRVARQMVLQFAARDIGQLTYKKAARVRRLGRSPDQGSGVEVVAIDDALQQAADVGAGAAAPLVQRVLRSIRLGKIFGVGSAQGWVVVGIADIAADDAQEQPLGADSDHVAVAGAVRRAAGHIGDQFSSPGLELLEPGLGEQIKADSLVVRARRERAAS